MKTNRKTKRNGYSLLEVLLALMTAALCIQLVLYGMQTLLQLSHMQQENTELRGNQ